VIAPVAALTLAAFALASAAAAPPAKPRLLSSPARATVPWTGTVTSQRRLAVRARNGLTTIPVAVRALGRSRYQLRAIFPFSGRWQLLSGRRVFAAVTVTAAPPIASALPGAAAFRLCGGTGAPYPQYALARDAGTGALYAACRAQARVHRIDPVTGETRAILRLPSTPYSIGAGFGAAWTVDRGAQLTRLDLRTGRAAAPAEGHHFAYVWASAGSVWAAENAEPWLVRYDPATRARTPIAVGDGPSALVEDDGRVWIVNHRDATLQRVDLATNTAATLARLPGDAPERMTHAEGSLWITGRGTDLLRVDAATGAVRATIEIGAGGIGVQAAAHAIWVAVASDEDDAAGNPFLERLVRVDPATNAVTETIRPSRRIVVNGMTSSGTALWLADTAAGRLYRISD
jgi:hypothetical protein